jgi:hypothetical protein
MALTISLTNTSTEDQSVTLFDNGGANSNNFTTLNQSSVAQSQFISAPSGIPSTQQVFQAGKYYYDSVFDSSGYYFGSVGTILGITAIINGVTRTYQTNITTIANRTFDDIQTILTNLLRNAGVDPRPNAQVILNATTQNSIQYLNVNVLDNVLNGDSVLYSFCRLYCSTANIGVGSSSPIFYDQVYGAGAGQPSPNFKLSTSPNTAFADADGWFIIQGINLTTSTTFQFSVYDSYLQSVSFASGFAYQFEFQLTEPLPNGNFAVLNQPGSTLILAINGSITSVQTFSNIIPNATQRISIANSLTQSPAWNGQLKMRIRPMSNVNAPYHYSDQSILNQIGTGGSFISNNPNVVTPAPVSGVGLKEIINSTAGSVYKITSIYIFSTNPNQVTAPITFAKKDANGNLIQTDLDVVIDPNAPQSIAYRTDAMEGFIIDSNALINLTVKAESSVNVKMEYEVLSYDEIREKGLALDLDLNNIEIEKEILDLEYGTPGSDLDDFYTLQ